MSWIRYPVTAALACALAVTTRAPDAHAQFIHRLYLHGELGLGTMLSSHARDALGYDSLGGELTLRAGVRLVGPLNLQVGLGNWLWRRDSGSNGRLLSLEIGLRASFVAGSIGSFWIDANVGPGFTGDLTRLHFNVGLGFDFAVSRYFALGPFARIGELLQTGDTTTTTNTPGGLDSATFWAAGLNVSFHVPAPVSSPPPVIGDRDGDGVLDPDDQCADLPRGDHPDPERRGCPTGDRDGDGVLDPQDLCPTFPMGDEPNPDRLGCPDDDNDGDGLVDHRDQCPLEAMDPRPDPDRVGCRRPETVINLGEILFTTDSTGIVDNEQNDRALRLAQTLFSSHEEITLFSIEGHTDERDSDHHNLDLSRRRADSVRDWLAAHGIARDRMIPAGYGEACPVDPGHTEEAWARNRRVVFVIARRGTTAEAGASFGCAAGAAYIPPGLSPTAPTSLATPVTPEDAGGHHGHHGHHGGGGHHGHHGAGAAA
jgi:outer membrane protein OmpA-like peptidoglycan-associated protein